MRTLNYNEMVCIQGGISDCAKAWWGLGLSSLTFVTSLIACGTGVGGAVGIGGIYVSEAGIAAGLAGVGTKC